MTFNNDTLLTNTPLTNISSSNDSAEISKEIKKMLDDRCSSSEFRDFVEHINLDGKCSFMQIKKICSKITMYKNVSCSIQIRSYGVRGIVMPRWRR